MEGIPNKNIVRGMAALAAVTGALALAGCGEDNRNYTGVGNHFEIEAVVDHHGDHSITIESYPERILLAHGKAAGWFDDGDEHQIHDNYEHEGSGVFGSCEDLEVVGEVINKHGNIVPLSDVPSGQPVEVEGYISESSAMEGKVCETDDRPVFTKVIELSGYKGL